MTDSLQLQGSVMRTGSSGKQAHPVVFQAGMAQTRCDLADILAAIEEVAAHQGEEAVSHGVSVLRQKVDRNLFYLTVVGQFKRGKTSFLNALLGAQVLPVAILPLTSVVTILRYGSRPRAEVVFLSGNRSAIELADLPDYVTEKGNPKNVKAVSHVEVEYPSEYLRGGVALVDTPGIGSVYTHNTEVTYGFLPQVDAAIFVTSPEPPIARAEIEFLADLAAQVRKVFVVLNKTDLLNDQQLKDVVDFTLHSLPPGVASSDSFFCVSAARALQGKQKGDATHLDISGFGNLEKMLGQFLASDRNRLFYASVAGNARKLISDLRLSIQLRVRAAQTPLDELRAKFAKLNEYLAHAEQEREDSQVLLQNNVMRLSGLVETEARRFAETNVAPLRDSIRAHLGRLGGSGRKALASEMDKFLKARVEEIFGAWRTEFEDQASEHFRQATHRFVERVNEIIAGVRRTAGSLFGFEVENFAATEELTELEPCGYFTDPVLDWGLGNAPLMLPRGLFRSYLLRVMLRKAESELERNATRVAFDFKKRLNRSLALLLEGMTGKLDETVDGIRRALESAVARHQEDSVAAGIELEEQTAILGRLDECDQRLAGIFSQYEGTGSRAFGPCAMVGEENCV